MRNRNIKRFGLVQGGVVSDKFVRGLWNLQPCLHLCDWSGCFSAGLDKKHAFLSENKHKNWCSWLRQVKSYTHLSQVSLTDCEADFLRLWAQTVLTRFTDFLWYNSVVFTLLEALRASWATFTINIIFCCRWRINVSRTSPALPEKDLLAHCFEHCKSLFMTITRRKRVWIPKIVRFLASNKTFWSESLNSWPNFFLKLQSNLQNNWKHTCFK